ncbi:MAG: flagellar basal body rod protein FlgB [Caldilineaceae bacterium]|nr:flagellar basal body rod protein FlgB [Caldilineaceae bacterium]
MNITSDLSLTLLQKGLDALSERQTVIAHNVANVETPGYKASDVAFEDSLRRALHSGADLGMQTTDPDHLTAAGARQQEISEIAHTTYRRNQTSMRKDGNNVDIENEMLDLAETGLRYQAMTSLASKKLAMLRMVVQESR